MERKWKRSAPIVRQYRITSRLWNVAGWSIIVLDVFLLVVFPATYGQRQL